MAEAGVKGGLIAHVGCEDGRLTTALRAHDSFMVHALAADPSDVDAARAHVRGQGLYGPVNLYLTRHQSKVLAKIGYGGQRHQAIE